MNWFIYIKYMIILRWNMLRGRKSEKGHVYIYEQDLEDKQEIKMDPFTVTILTIIGCSFASFMIGYNLYKIHRDEVINDTIVYLCDNGFIKHYTNEKNDIEIVTLNGEIPNGSQSEKEEG